MTTFDAAACLLVFAAVIGLANDRWFGLPRNIALLLGALGVASVAMAADVWLYQGHALTYWRLRIEHANLPSVLLDGVLALLLFAGSMHVDLRELRDRAWPVALLATGGVILATGLFGLGFHLLTDVLGEPVPLIWCLVLGAILAPTDAVVVEGLLRQVRMPPMLRGTISGESLFNDGAAVVVFLAALAMAGGQSDVVGGGRLGLRIVEEVVLGGLVGWAGGSLTALACRTLKDRSLELTLSLALALGSYRLASGFDLSGPIAVVAAGLAFRYSPWRSARTKGAEAHPSSHTIASWDVIDDLLNTLLFMLMGFQLLAVTVGAEVSVLLPLSFLLALLARAVSVCPAMLALRVPAHDRLLGVGVLTWTGLRGGISIALVLTLPDTPHREVLLAVGYGVVIASIVVQGLSVPMVLRMLYRARPTKDADGPADTGLTP